MAANDPPDDVRLYRVNPALNMRRFYNLTVERDLLGQPVLVRHWGRIGGAGRIKLEPHETQDKAARALDDAAMRKIRRGYRRKP